MRNLDTSLNRKEEAYNECIDEKKNIQSRNTLLEKSVAEIEAENNNLRDKTVS